MIKVDRITKKYNRREVLKEISFEVPKREIFGLIGPDGAGKSTLFRMLTTLILPDSGTAQIDNRDLIKNWRAIRKIIGYMSERFSLYHDLTVEENIVFYAQIFGTTIQQNYHLIEEIYQQLYPFRDRRAGALSGGMKKKLALCCALIHQPKILFLDEPTAGLDPLARNDFWEMIKKIQEKEITVLISTSYMQEATACDRIALLDNGTLLAVNEPDNIKKQFSKQLLTVSTSDMYKLLLDLRNYPNAEKVYTFGEVHHLIAGEQNEPHNDDAVREDITQYLRNLAHENICIEQIKPTIEDCFMDLSTTVTSQFPTYSFEPSNE